MTKLIQADFNGQAMQFTADGWFCATTAAARYGKRPNDWLSLPETGKYLEALTRKYGEIPFFKTKRGGDTGKSGNAQGTWLHPKLAVRFAQWLDMDFAVWCDEQIDALIRGQSGPDEWAMARIEAGSRYRGMCDMLHLSRLAQGKETKRYHYSNEALLINQILTGKRIKRDRNSLSKIELRLLDLMETENTRLIALQVPSDERKIKLTAFYHQQRQRLAIPANDVAGRISA
ncbi:KilA-N domain-containing protein [Chromobacterium paludis]|uniref:KilA-N domain-containing protein n=1 Tax=Chromobacterium paludis TaxID=2605945 RepID=A0A5C1DJ74_9NEIS|nr:KilA-N domain-containing protein [Chromobacterium paludis]QEL56603.1 KilA-N domain-containing protein [Chromobacterium paludis]